MIPRASSAWSCLVIGLLWTACADREALTQLTVEVHSDIDDLDRITIDVEGLGADRSADANLEDDPLPRRLGLVHRGGPLGPILVTVKGWTDDDKRVERVVRVSFVRGKSLLLAIELETVCQGVKCDGDEQTCIRGQCAGIDVDSSELPPYDPDGADSDTAVPLPGGGGPGGPSDGSVDGSVLPDGAPAGGSANCDKGFADCNGDGVDCESRLDSLKHCGACDEACAFDPDVDDPHASLTCEKNECEVEACDDGFFDADGDPENGCEFSEFAFMPSNFGPDVEPLLEAADVDVRVDCDASFDSGANGAGVSAIKWCGTTLVPIVVSQPGGPEAVLVAMRSLTVEAEKTLFLTGERPVILVVFGDATVTGTIRATAAGATPGPGGNVSCLGGRGMAGEDGGSDGGGGGAGGAFGTPGGQGGTGGSQGITGGAGGVAEGTDSLVPLRGGCGGGDGGLGAAPGGDGGAGGGAVQVSVAGTLRVTGVISASGGGGTASGGAEAGGGGGGSGGGVLLEAGQVDIKAAAWITANGGSGAEGSGLTSSLGASGKNGRRAGAGAALGGSGGEPFGGDGGNGGAVGTPPLDGQTGDMGGLGDGDDHGGGGGGGSVGRIRINGNLCALKGNLSPAATSDCKFNFVYAPANFDPIDVATEADDNGDVVIDCDVTFDTGDSGPLAPDTWCGQDVAPIATQQLDGTDVVIVPVHDLIVESGSTLSIVGGRPVLFAVFGSSAIHGSLGVSATGDAAGPGADLLCTGVSDTAGEHGNGDGGGGGGGGGGLSIAGGAGGNGNNDFIGKAGGAPGGIAGVAELVPLTGGCSGGDGGDGDGPGGLGGGGGGAVQISAAGTLEVTGVISAAGGGGRAPLSQESGGGGGGSGGAILLQGSFVNTVPGSWLSVNGGAGAEGNGAATSTADFGEDGAGTTLASATGGASGALGGDGGAGSAGASPADVGQAGSSQGGLGDGNDNGGGGGGGAVGRIRVEAITACSLVGSVSPLAFTNGFTSLCP